MLLNILYLSNVLEPQKTRWILKARPLKMTSKMHGITSFKQATKSIIKWKDHPLDLKDDLEDVLALALELKKGKYRNAEPLKGKSMAMIFEKASTRTRVSFEVGMSQMGGHAIFLSPKDMQIGPNVEPISEKPRPPMMVPPGLKNLASGSKVTCSDKNVTGENLGKLTDGDKSASGQSSRRRPRAWTMPTFPRPSLTSTPMPRWARSSRAPMTRTRAACGFTSS